MTERRKDERIALDDVWITISVVDGHIDKELVNAQTRKTMEVRIQNKSGGGLCLISDKPLDLGQQVISEDLKMPFQGVVVWTCQSKVECKAGIQFTLS